MWIASVHLATAQAETEPHRPGYHRTDVILRMKKESCVLMANHSGANLWVFAWLWLWQRRLRGLYTEYDPSIAKMSRIKPWLDQNSQ